MKTMAKAKHYGSRISQRGIRYGEKLLLGHKQIRHVIGAFDHQRKELIRVMDKGGVVLSSRMGSRSLPTTWIASIATTRNYWNPHYR